MPNPDNINNMTDRRSSYSMSDDQRAEFNELKGIIGECTNRVGVEVGRARKGHEIIISRLDRTDAIIVEARENGDRRLKEHRQTLNYHTEEIKRLKQGELDNIAEIKKLSEGLTGVINKVDQMGHVVLTTNTVASSLQITQGDGFITMGRQFAAVGDAINQLRSDLKSSNSAASKKWSSNLPVKVWFGIGAGIMVAVVFVVAAATGNIELIDKIKSAF